MNDWSCRGTSVGRLSINSALYIFSFNAFSLMPLISNDNKVFSLEKALLAKNNDSSQCELLGHFLIGRFVDTNCKEILAHQSVQ